MEAADIKGLQSGSSWLSALMIDVAGDLVLDLPCVQQASYLEGGPLMWMLPLYLHVNQKFDYCMMMMIEMFASLLNVDHSYRTTSAPSWIKFFSIKGYSHL